MYTNQCILINKSVTSGMTLVHRNDLIKYNANIVGSLVEPCSEICPKALIMIASNPVNALVPFAAEILKKHGTFDARRLFGVTTLDVVRAETFLAGMLGTISELGAGVEVAVIGGHSAETMVPLFSQIEMAKELSGEQIDELIYRKQNAVASFSIQHESVVDTSAGGQTPNMAARRCSLPRKRKAEPLYQLPMLSSGTLDHLPINEPRVGLSLLTMLCE